MSPPHPPTGSGLGTAWVLFAVVAAILAAFTAAIAMMMLVRLRRRRADMGASRRRPPSTVDPWAEAGRRARAFPERKRGR